MLACIQIRPDRESGHGRHPAPAEPAESAGSWPHPKRLFFSGILPIQRTGNQTSPPFPPHITPEPLQHDFGLIIEFDQKPDMDEHPNQPRGKSTEAETSQLAHRGISADHGEIPLMAVAKVPPQRICRVAVIGSTTPFQAPVWRICELGCTKPSVMGHVLYKIVPLRK